jgi:transposase-like protein
MSDPHPPNWTAWARVPAVTGIGGPGDSSHAIPSCPRCSCPRVQSWGRFSGRRRFRCMGCSRTFSSLTGTVLERCRRIDAWVRYLDAMEERLTLRQAASHAGIALRTSFRWRHRILESARVSRTRSPVLLASVFLSRLRVAKCAPPQGSMAAATDGAYPWIITLLDVGEPATPPPRQPHPALPSGNEGRASPRIEFSIVPVSKRFPERGSIVQYLLRSVAAGGKLVGGNCRRAAFREATEKGGWLWVTDSDDPVEKGHADEARAIGLGLRAWLAPFYGVSRRYLPNYLEWCSAAWRAPPLRLSGSARRGSEDFRGGGRSCG